MVILNQLALTTRSVTQYRGTILMTSRTILTVLVVDLTGLNDFSEIRSLVLS